MKIGIEIERERGPVRIWFPLHHLRLLHRVMKEMEAEGTPFKLLFNLRRLSK